MAGRQGRKQGNRSIRVRRALERSSRRRRGRAEDQVFNFFIVDIFHIIIFFVFITIFFVSIANFFVSIVIFGVFFCRDHGILCAGRSLPSWTLTKVDSSQKVRMMRAMMIVIIIFPGNCDHNFVSDEMLAVISGSFTGDKVTTSQTPLVNFATKNVSRLFVVCRS